MRTQTKFLTLAFSLFFASAAPFMAHAGLSIGDQCKNETDLPTSECASGECEDSDIEIDNDNFCVCDEDAQCLAEAAALKLTAEPGEKWACVDGEDDSFDLDFCQSTAGKKIYPVSKEKTEELKKKQAEEKAAANTAVTPSSAMPTAKVSTDFETVPPEINVKIPGLEKFQSEKIKAGDTVSIPWIAQYIAAIYKYAVSIGAVIAVLALIIGGLRYLISGAYAPAAKGAKDMMIGAVGGLAVLMSAYLILQMINPKLTQLGSLSITSIPLEYDVIADKDAEGGYISGGSSGTCAAPKNSVLAYCGVTTNSAVHPNKEALIQKIKNWAACGNFNYNILMGMAEHESSFRPGLVNCCCFKGLFQFKNDTWTFSMGGWPGGNDVSYYLSQLGLSTSPLSKTDARLFNDDVQLMGITGATLMAKNKIIARCKGDISKLKDGDIATLLYLFHNSGTGSLGNVLANGGCNGGENVEKAFIKSWTDIITTRCKERAFNKGKAVCIAGDGGYQNDKWTGGPYKSVAEAEAGGKMFGEGKARSVRKAGEARIIGKYKATDLFQAVPGAGTCPIKMKGK